MRRLVQRIRGRVSTSLRSVAAKARVVEAPISSCVHFCAFRYGQVQYNPYETYVVEVQRGMPIDAVRQRFIDFLRQYRPRNMGEALGVIGLPAAYPLWVYPWDDVDLGQFGRKMGWCDDPNEAPDILTHFSDRGILSFRIEQEFYWLGRALQAIRDEGYQPCKYGYVRALQLCRRDGDTAYLLLDGNHRVSALSALGYQKVMLEYDSNAVVREQDCDGWRGVARGAYNKDDALRIFAAYFVGNEHYVTTADRAPILEPPYWGLEVL